MNNLEENCSTSILFLIEHCYSVKATQDLIHSLKMQMFYIQRFVMLSEKLKNILFF
jgi:hypothetical protein